jgi:hypothetical protein
MFKQMALIFILSSLYLTSANATIITDPSRYEDLSAGTSYDLAGFTIVGPVSGPADLSIRFGHWNGDVTAILELVFTFNGSVLSPLVESTGAYFSSPESITYNVGTLVSSGLNTLSVFATLTSIESATYTVGEITLEYTSSNQNVSSPATLALMGLGLIGLGWSSRKRVQ